LSTDITGALSSTTSFSLICEHKSGDHPLMQIQPSTFASCCSRHYLLLQSQSVHL
jgi:hypothetical protein